MTTREVARASVGKRALRIGSRGTHEQRGVVYGTMVGASCVAISWDSVGHEVAGRGAGAVMVLLAREVPWGAEKWYFCTTWNGESTSLPCSGENVAIGAFLRKTWDNIHD